MKNMTTALIVALVLVAFFAQNSVAQQKEVIIYEDIFSSKIDLPEIYQEDIEEMLIEKRRESQVPESYETKGSAPALSYLEVYAIGSSQYGGYEMISASQFSTNGDHGGQTLIAVTLELGYGFSQIAKMNGNPGTNTKSDTVCWNSSGNLVYCSAGQTVAGWVRYWDISGPQSGYFTYQNTSTNYPYNTMSDALSIQ